jgi:hypothetical protein
MIDETEFLPFHAINEFMRPDFRLSVIRETLSNQEKVGEPYAHELTQQIKKKVTVPGFRNSDKAPALVKVLPTSKAFEKYPELVVALLACWAENQAELRDQVFGMLKNRNWPIFTETYGTETSALSPDVIKTWPIFPKNFNRTRLPGFFTHWPKGEDFEVLYTNYSSLFPDSNASIDKVSLMVVWLTMRLPYHVDMELLNSDKPVSPEDTA